MQARAIQTQENILRSAISLFADQGYAGTSVDNIAADAHINKQRIYAYYGSKQKLFEQCLLRVFAEADRKLAASRANLQDHPEKLTEMICRSYFSLHRSLPVFWRLLSWANLENLADSTLLNTVRTSEDSCLKKAFDLAISKNLIRKIDFQVYILNIMSTIYFFYSNQQTLKHTFGLPTQEQIIDNLQRLYQPDPLN